MPLFRVTVERIDGPLNSEHPDLLSFETRNHDDVLAIAHRARHLPGMEPDEAASLAIGMKLFGEVMLKYRKQSPYAELMPHFREFIGAYKSAVRAAVEPVPEAARATPTYTA